jgi:hypothetical protein
MRRLFRFRDNAFREDFYIDYVCHLQYNKIR